MPHGASSLGTVIVVDPVVIGSGRWIVYCVEFEATLSFAMQEQFKSQKPGPSSNPGTMSLRSDLGSKLTHPQLRVWVRFDWRIYHLHGKVQTVGQNLSANIFLLENLGLGLQLNS